MKISEKSERKNGNCGTCKCKIYEMRWEREAKRVVRMGSPGVPPATGANTGN